MSISPFFLGLRSAYQSEMDDLRFDSEGRDVLHQRLAEKRGELGFLVQMMELSPEMVAVIFHQGFDFKLPAVMDHLLSHEADEFPEWRSVADGLELTPWAQYLARVVLKAPGGEWFLTVAAGLEYMAGRARGLPRTWGTTAPMTKRPMKTAARASSCWTVMKTAMETGMPRPGMRPAPPTWRRPTAR